MRLSAASPSPEILLGLLFYGYATGVFNSRKIERATRESISFRFIASGWHPDHDTIAHFRKTFLAEIQELFVQILLLVQTDPDSRSMKNSTDESFDQHYNVQLGIQSQALARFDG